MFLEFIFCSQLSAVASMMLLVSLFLYVFIVMVSFSISHVPVSIGRLFFEQEINANKMRKEMIVVFIFSTNVIASKKLNMRMIQGSQLKSSIYNIINHPIGEKEIANDSYFFFSFFVFEYFG